MTEIKTFLKDRLNWDVEDANISLPASGATNYNYTVCHGENKYAVRIGAENPTALSIDRQSEFAAIKTASRVIETAELEYFDPQNGNMVTRYIDGRVLENSDWQNFEVLDRVINRLKLLHGEKTDYIFMPFRDVEERLDFCRGQNMVLPKHAESVFAKLKTMQKRTKAEADQFTGLCHNDPFPCNFILHGDTVYTLDFEFSKMGDIFFDLACIAWASDEKSQRYMLETYFGFCDDRLFNRLMDYLFIVQAWNASWALVKSVYTSQPYDFYEAAENLIKQMAGSSE